jgi:hypothetical protein
MDDSDALRAVLCQKAEAICVDQAIPVELPNEQFTPDAAQTYASFWYRVGGSKQAELGGNTGYEMTVGLLQFDLLVPEYQPLGPPSRIADAIKRAFNRKEWIVPPEGYVKTLVASVKTPFHKPQNGWYRFIIDATFHYYHRDPTAPDFRS